MPGVSLASAWRMTARPAVPIFECDAAGVGSGSVTPKERWLGAVWPFVRSWLPASPARVIEIGCGSLGGFVPMLRAAGYDAAGVDPQAPDGRCYHRVEFERYEPPGPAGAVVACTSLHHVADIGDVLNRVQEALAADGSLVVIEWARERFDEATARWCFDRLPAPAGDRGWLEQRYDEWQVSGLPWRDYCRAWAEQEGLHAGQDIVGELDARFDRQLLAYGPYFFPDVGISEADEQEAIDVGEIQANRIAYVGRPRRGGDHAKEQA